MWSNRARAPASLLACSNNRNRPRDRAIHKPRIPRRGSHVNRRYGGAMFGQVRVLPASRTGCIIVCAIGPRATTGDSLVSSYCEPLSHRSEPCPLSFVRLAIFCKGAQPYQKKCYGSRQHGSRLASMTTYRLIYSARDSVERNCTTSTRNRSR